VRLVLSGAREVPATLATVPGVTAVVADGEADGRTAWSVQWTGAEPPVPGLLAAAAAAGWTVHAAAPETRTLETVFKELQAKHVTARSGGAA
jgi:hypothetical protein